MRFTKAVAFVCPDCEKPVGINGAGLTADGRILLTGPCSDCRVQVVMDIEKVIITVSGGYDGKAN